jgi:hypothetical protein
MVIGLELGSMLKVAAGQHNNTQHPPVAVLIAQREQGLLQPTLIRKFFIKLSNWF